HQRNQRSESCLTTLGEVHDESVYGAIERLVLAAEQVGFTAPDLIRMLNEGTPTVLGVDDFTNGLSEAIELLREEGYEVLAAADRQSSGQQAESVDSC